MAVRLRLMAVKIDWSMTLISEGNCSKGPALCKTGENVTRNNIRTEQEVATLWLVALTY